MGVRWSSDDRIRMSVVGRDGVMGRVKLVEELWMSTAGLVECLVSFVPFVPSSCFMCSVLLLGQLALWTRQ